MTSCMSARYNICTYLLFLEKQVWCKHPSKSTFSLRISSMRGCHWPRSQLESFQLAQIEFMQPKNHSFLALVDGKRFPVGDFNLDLIHFSVLQCIVGETNSAKPQYQDMVDPLKNKRHRYPIRADLVRASKLIEFSTSCFQQSCESHISSERCTKQPQSRFLLQWSPAGTHSADLVDGWKNLEGFHILGYLPKRCHIDVAIIESLIQHSEAPVHNCSIPT